MRLMPFLCIGGTEIANQARVTTYGAREFFDGDCPCPALDQDVFVSPSADPAPWYEATQPASEDFVGFLPQSITLSPPASRSTGPIAGEGSVFGPVRMPGRVMEVTGWMVARSLEAMWYGERWLTEALRGNRCAEGCLGDVLTVLPFCREEDGSPDFSGDFRTLVGGALVDGPRWTEASDDASYMIVNAQFQLVSRMPYLYHPATRCIDAEPLTGTLDCSLTTPELNQDGTFVIDIRNDGTADLTDILVQGQISLDGDCPVDTPGSSVPPSFVYSIPTLAPGDRITIDGTRRKASYYDASAKRESSALPYITWDGPFPWPDVGPCTTMCVTVSEQGSTVGDATVTVDSYLREL